MTIRSSGSLPECYLNSVTLNWLPPLLTDHGRVLCRHSSRGLLSGALDVLTVILTSFKSITRTVAERSLQNVSCLHLFPVRSSMTSYCADASVAWKAARDPHLHDSSSASCSTPSPVPYTPVTTNSPASMPASLLYAFAEGLKLPSSGAPHTPCISLFLFL